jgi:hypothetical protein
MDESRELTEVSITCLTALTKQIRGMVARKNHTWSYIVLQSHAWWELKVRLALRNLASDPYSSNPPVTTIGCSVNQLHGKKSH